MAEVIRMPKLSDTMTDGVVASWNKKVGDTIKRGEILAEIETDKATMEFESFFNGTLLYIGIEKGDGAPVDAIIAIIGAAGDDVAAILAAEELKVPAKKEEVIVEKKVEKKPEVQSQKKSKPIIVQSDESGDGRLKASPLAKRMAGEKGIDIYAIQGSGGAGRVVKRDVDAWHPSRIPPVMQHEVQFDVTVNAAGEYTDEPISQMRKVIAKRLSESCFEKKLILKAGVKFLLTIW